MQEAKWTNGKKTISGRWVYIWHLKTFIVELSTGRRIVLLGNDTPEWGKWKKIKDNIHA